MSYDERITTYYGDAVIRAGFLPIPHLLMRHYAALDLNADQAMFAMQLMAITWDLAQPPDTMKKLAQRMGVSLRTAQRYSEQLSERGLLIVYEQFQAGAQVENGYDLSPLFDRLATFAPEPRPGGEPRERRARPAAPQDAARAQDTVATSAGRAAIGSVNPGVRDDIPPGDSPVIPPHVSPVIPPDVTPDTPARDSAAAPAPTPLSGLKKELKNPHKKQTSKKQHHAAAVVSDRDRLYEHAAPDAPNGGHSLRWDLALTPDQVAASREVLRRAGLNAHVVDAGAIALHPAECWGLWCYARGAGLGTGWIAAELYDFAERHVRLTSQARAYDAAGRLLAALSPPMAETILDLIDAYCPDRAGALRNDPRYAAADAGWRAAFEAVWAARVEQAGAGRRTTQPPAQAAATGRLQLLDPVAPAALACWTAVRERLAQTIPRDEYETWIAPLTPVLLEADLAVIATPNIFVRTEVAEHYAAPIVAALAAELGHPCRLELVIDQQLAA